MLICTYLTIFFVISYYTTPALKNQCYHLYVNISFGKLMLTLLLSLSVNNRCWKSLITDVKTLFSSSVALSFHPVPEVFVLANKNGPLDKTSG